MCVVIKLCVYFAYAHLHVSSSADQFKKLLTSVPSIADKEGHKASPKNLLNVSFSMSLVRSLLPRVIDKEIVRVSYSGNLMSSARTVSDPRIGTTCKKMIHMFFQFAKMMVTTQRQLKGNG